MRPAALLPPLLGLLPCSVVANYEIFTQRYSADPAPLVTGGRMYITTSHDLANNTGWNMRDYNCLSSDDLVNWRDEGIVFSMDTVRWANLAWAQQVVEAPNGTFLMAFPGMGGNFSWSYPGGVGIASSTSPAGPFVDQLGKAIMPGDDPTLFVDKRTGEVHLCSNLNGPNCGILAADLKSWTMQPPNLPHWPTGSQTIAGSEPPFTKQGWHWYEAPWIHQIEDTFYLSFMMSQQSTGSLVNYSGKPCPTGACAALNCSWAHYGADLGYAMSSVSPVTNHSYQGTLMWAPPYNCGLAGLSNESVSLCNTTGGDNAHHGMAEFPAGSGRQYLVYHTRKLAAERGDYRGYQRNIALDRLYVNRTDMRLLPVTATPDWLRPAKFLNPFERTPAFTIAGASANVNTEPCGDIDSEAVPGAKQLNLRFREVGSSIFVRAVDFGSGATAVHLRIATAADAFLEIRSGEAIIAGCRLPATGGAQSWASVLCPIDAGRVVGVHNTVRFIFRCPSCTGSAASLGFRHWQFTGGKASGAVPPATTVAVRVRSRGSRRYLVADDEGRVTTASTTGSNTSFILLDREDGSWSIEAADRLLCTQADGSLIASQPRGSASECSRFRLQPTVDSSWAVQSYTSRRWLVGTAEGIVRVAAEDPRGLADDGGRFDFEDSAHLRPSVIPRKSDDSASAVTNRWSAARRFSLGAGGASAAANCTHNDTVRGSTMFANASPYSIGGWDGKDWQSCASFCETDPIGGHPCMAWELAPNYKVGDKMHPLACLFYATVPDCVESHAAAGVTGCGMKGLSAQPDKCCLGGQCRAQGFRCSGPAGLYQCERAGPSGGNGTAFPDEQTCQQHCQAPPPPPPGPPPPPPTYSKPYIRFAQVIPLSNLEVNCTIAQGGTTHTWAGFGFGDFSEWTTIFTAGAATLTIAAEGKVVLTRSVTLTPGPLVVALRPDNVPVGHYWPPTPTSIELIAASYTPGRTGTSSVRLFNLSPTTAAATMTVGGKAVAQGVKFSVGSAWVPVPAGQETFQILDSATQAQLATATGSPPRSPGAATLYLYGVELTGTAAKLLSDAPERGANAGAQALKLDDRAEEHGAAQESPHRPSSVGVWHKPPAALPFHEIADVPQLGNGQIGVQLDARATPATNTPSAPAPPSPAPGSVGPGRAGVLDIWLSSNGFWSCQPSNMSLANGTCGKGAVGGVSIAVGAEAPGLIFVNFTQHIQDGTIKSHWQTGGGGTLATVTTLHPTRPLATTTLDFQQLPGGSNHSSPSLTLNVSTWVVGASDWHAAPGPGSTGCAEIGNGASAPARFPVDCSRPQHTVTNGVQLAAVASRHGNTHQSDNAPSPRPRWAAIATAVTGNGATMLRMKRHAPEGGPGSGYYATGPEWGTSMLVRVAAGAAASLVTAEVEVASFADDPSSQAAAALRVALAPGELSRLEAERRAHIESYWSRAGISLPTQPAVEALWWGAVGGLAAAVSSDPAVPTPGLYGPFASADYAYWNGDYTLDCKRQCFLI